MLHRRTIARTIALAATLALGACTENDTQITQRVQDRLATEGVAPDQVHVSTLRRVVVLEGVVNDTAELNRAELAARQVPGIMGIDNRLVVKNPVNTTGGKPEDERAP
jgi:osmotically-inducible protein OsmY